MCRVLLQSYSKLLQHLFSEMKHKIGVQQLECMKYTVLSSLSCVRLYICLQSECGCQLTEVSIDRVSYS